MSDADKFVRNLTLVYEEILKGVYIQGVSGTLYTESEWNNQETPNGIAVLTDECQFVMSLEQGMYNSWGAVGILVPDILTSELEADVTGDYNGFANTQKIIESDDSTHAAKMSYYNIFPNGKNGYLGSVGEWQAVVNNLSAINSALVICGYPEMIDHVYWTSTQCNADFAWTCHLYVSGLIYINSKEENKGTWPFTTL